MWKHYQRGNTIALLTIAENFKEQYSFLLPAVQAHIERLTVNGNAGRPERVLVEIMEELNTKEFKIVFREFCKREPIYGFGDSQVRRMWKKIIDNP
jgi:hypothetical protein